MNWLKKFKIRDKFIPLLICLFFTNTVINSIGLATLLRIPNYMVFIVTPAIWVGFFAIVFAYLLLKFKRLLKIVKISDVKDANNRKIIIEGQIISELLTVFMLFVPIVTIYFLSVVKVSQQMQYQDFYVSVVVLFLSLNLLMVLGLIATVYYISLKGKFKLCDDSYFVMRFTSIYEELVNFDFSISDEKEIEESFEEFTTVYMMTKNVIIEEAVSLINFEYWKTFKKANVPPEVLI
ncbi:hypothetical protein SCHIN_v1c01710 [Spiroplasma chinense]|uniref:Transmembrane protein n=1 Tax=Spiroplasma chinense TaxID=216932 RepID=A0A5B9Y3W4_9MOLU|nr:hypothetical protein [Spiroplasma chinense]QEH61369.1 hypothetical protein SCHIN_v1c01710 [Spiroplasma chinense]